MSLEISRENEQIIQDAVTAGGYHSPDEVLTRQQRANESRRAQICANDSCDGYVAS